MKALFLVVAAGSVAGLVPLGGRAEAQPAQALANEKLRGSVLVGGRMYGTAAAARAAGRGTSAGAPGADAMWAGEVRVDLGDVVQVATTPAAGDCMPGRDSPYRLLVWVRRDELIPRLASDVARTFPDGTAIAIQRGAPAEITASGLAWADRVLAKSAVPGPTKIVYAVAGRGTATLPRAPGEALICDPSPQTPAAWDAAHRARPAPPPARAAKPAAPCTGDLATCMADALTSESDAVAGAMVGDRRGPACGLGSGDVTLAGAPLVIEDRNRDRGVYLAPGRTPGPAYLGDVTVTCGLVRVATDATPVAERRANGGAALAVHHGRAYQPTRGPVTWPDGMTAGRYDGNVVYSDAEVTIVGDRYCVQLAELDQRVCHRKKDVVVTP